MSSGNWIESWHSTRSIFYNFRDRLSLNVNVISWLTEPLPHDIYWVDSTKNNKKGKAQFQLSRKPINGKPHRMVGVLLNPRKITVTVRVNVPRAKFVRACSNKQIKLLRPDLCVDNSTYRVIMQNCDMERAAQAAEVCTKLIEAGEL